MSHGRIDKNIGKPYSGYLASWPKFETGPWQSTQKHYHLAQSARRFKDAHWWTCQQILELH